MSEVGIRIVRVDKGLTLSGEDIKTCTISRKIDYSSESCPYGTCQLSIYNKNGVEYDFEENEKIEVYKDDILDGVFFLDDIKRNSVYSWNIYAIDYIGYLAKLPFMGDNFSYSNEVFSALEEQSGITFDIDERILEVPIGGYILYGDCKTALEQVCFVVGCVADTSGIDGIKLRMLNNIPTQTITKNRVLVGGKIEEKINNINGAIYDVIEDTYNPNQAEYSIIFSSSADEIGTRRIIDYGGRAFNVQFDGYNPIIATAVSALVERVDNGDIIASVTGKFPNIPIRRQFKYYANQLILSPVAQLSEMSLKPVDMNILLERVYNNNTTHKKLSCKIANKKTVTKRASTYGEYLYGETVYGYTEVTGITYDNPINIGDCIEVPTEYGIYTVIITSEKYSLNNPQLVKNIEARIVS